MSCGLQFSHSVSCKLWVGSRVRLWVGSRISLHYIKSALSVKIISSLHVKRSKSNNVIDIFHLRATIRFSVIYSSLPNGRVARNKRDGEKDELFLITVVPGISMVVKVFRPVTEIKKKQNDLKLLIKTKQKNQTMVHLLDIKLIQYVHCLFSMLFQILLRA